MKTKLLILAVGLFGVALLMCAGGCAHHRITPRALSRLMSDSPDPFIIAIDVGDTIQDSANPNIRP